jgi:hypothetical protein
MSNFSDMLRTASDQIAAEQQLTIADIYDARRRASLRRLRTIPIIVLVLFLGIPAWLVISGIGVKGAKVGGSSGGSGQLGTVSGQWGLLRLTDSAGGDVPLVKASVFVGDFHDRLASGTLRVGGNVGALVWQSKDSTLTGNLGIHSLVAFSDAENKVYEMLTSMLSRGVSWQVDAGSLTLRGPGDQSAVFTLLGPTDGA